MDKIQYLKIDEEYIIEAIAFNLQKNIEENLPLIQWELVFDGGSEFIGKGKSVKYKLDKKYAGKKISFSGKNYSTN